MSAGQQHSAESSNAGNVLGYFYSVLCFNICSNAL